MPITLTPLAAKRIADYISNEALELGCDARDICFRVAVSMRCNGLMYELQVQSVAHLEETDISFNSGGVTIIVDKESYEYLKGSVIDYKTIDTESGFEITNPNTVQKCGCEEIHQI